MISYSVPNHVTPVFYYIISINNFYFSLLYRQVRISHQTLIHRMCDLTSLTDCPHDKRLSSVHITCCKYIFTLVAYAPSAVDTFVLAFSSTPNASATYFSVPRNPAAIRTRSASSFVSEPGTSDITMRPVFHPFCSLILR